jgi:NAD(P)-dependent dehydrogenase (short-subunit alcohol dehydrogenase family)
VNNPIYLITGATDGIGRATALALAERGARVILHGRNPGKLDATVEQLRAATGSKLLHPVLADFASLAEVAALGQQLRTDFPGINVLVNNAGLLADHWQQSADGFEMSFAVNYLAPFLLTLSLLDAIGANAPGRIVNVA